MTVDPVIATAVVVLVICVGIFMRQALAQRCPNCGKRWLGQVPRYCPRCGVELG